MMKFKWIFGPFVWKDNMWELPDGCISALDLRALSEMGPSALGLRNFALFRANVNSVFDSDYLVLGNGVIGSDIKIDHKIRNNIRDSLGLRSLPTSNNLSELIFELLTTYSDPDGSEMAKPLIPSLDRKWKISSLGFKKQFNYFGIEYNKVKDVWRRIYRQIRDESISGKIPIEYHRKWLGYKLEKFFKNNIEKAREFIDQSLPLESPIKPSTSFTETWTGANSGVPDGDQNWTEVSQLTTSDWNLLNNQIAVQGALNNGFMSVGLRCETALSSDDQEVEVDVVDLQTATSTQTAGLCTRFSTSAYTFYGMMLTHDGNLRWRKMVAGTTTAISSLTTPTVSYPDTMRYRMDGSNAEFWYNDVSSGTGTDTSITGNLNTGLAANISTSGSANDVIFDNFSATDELATVSAKNLAPRAVVPRRTHRYFNNCDLWLDSQINTGRKITNLCGRTRYFDIFGAVWSPGVNGGSLLYRGNDYAGINKACISNYPFTLFIWFKTSNQTAANRVLFSNSNSGLSSHGAGLRINSSHQLEGFVQAGGSENSVAFVTRQANNNQWNVGTLVARAANDISIYLNGEYGGDGTTDAVDFPTLDISTLGAFRSTTNDDFYFGYLGQSIVYSQALEERFIQSIIDDWSDIYRRKSYSFFIPSALFIPPPSPTPFYSRPSFKKLRPRIGDESTKNIVAWYPLNERIDQAKARNLAIPQDSAVVDGARYSNKGIRGGSFFFDGNSGIDLINNHSNLTFRIGDPITIFAVINPTQLTTGGRHIICGKDGDGFGQYNYWLALTQIEEGADAAKLEFHYRSGNDPQQFWSHELVIRINTDNIIAATYIFGQPNSAQLFLYKYHNRDDGAFHSPGAGWVFGTGEPAPHIGWGNFSIGYSPATPGTNNRFYGYISDVRILKSYTTAEVFAQMANDPWSSLRSQTMAKSFFIPPPFNVGAAMYNYRKRRIGR